MKSQTVSAVFSWIALLLAIGCAIGLVIAGASVAEIKQASQTGSGSDAGFVFLFVASYLALTGAGALIFGVAGLAMSPEGASLWQRRRCWIGILAGVAAAIVGFLYGVPFG